MAELVRVKMDGKPWCWARRTGRVFQIITNQGERTNHIWLADERDVQVRPAHFNLKYGEMEEDRDDQAVQA